MSPATANPAVKTTRAARLQSYGGAEAVRVDDVSLPEPKAGEVLVKIHAAGVNPVDWKIRTGYLQQHMPLQLPVTLGGDFAGVIEAVGPEVKDFKLDDEVYGGAGLFNGGSGSFAQFATTKADSIAAKPRKVNFTEAGALPLVGVSALQALTEHLHLANGQKILIHGGAGGIGGIAIQIAKHLGAYVATTVSTKNADYVKLLGADQIIDYKKQNFEEAVSGFDAVLDLVGGDTYVRSFKVLKKGGRIVSLLEQPREELRKQYGVEASVMFTQITTQRLAYLAKLVDQGDVKVHIDKIFPLDQATAALLYVEKESPKGKVVVKVA